MVIDARCAVAALVSVILRGMISGPRSKPGVLRAFQWFSRAVASQPAGFGPTSSDEELRALYQERLGLQHQLSFWMGAGFLFIGNTFFALDPALGLRGVAMASATAFHAVGALVDLGLWRWLRGKKRSLSFGALTAIDVVGQTLVLCAIAGLFMQDRRFDRPDLGLVLVLFYQLTARAIVVPSTAQRTLLVGVLGSIPVLVVSYLVSLRFTNPHGAPLDVIWPSYIALWCACATILTTAAARIIYGLRHEVEEARKVGQYTLQEKLGEGGMGVVYRARHAMLRRPTAIKLILPEKAGPQAVARFEREVQLTASLTHPNTVAIYDYGRTPDGTFYYAMEYLDGIDLEKVVELDGPQPDSRVVHLLTQALGALSEAHGVGLVHRDIKPANIMVCRRGGEHDVAKVVDFGLVKQIERTQDTLQTARSNVVGTPLYMAPEAITTPEHISASSDIYSIGAVAYLLISGTLAFSGSNILEICAQQLHQKPEPPSLRLGKPVHAGLERLVLQCLEKDPEQRPRSALELRRALLALDLPAWSERDAADWWQRLGPRLEALEPRRGHASHVASTLAVDMNARHAAN